MDAYTGSCCCEEALGASDGTLVSLLPTDRFGEDVVVSDFDGLAVGATVGSGIFLGALFDRFSGEGAAVIATDGPMVVGSMLGHGVSRTRPVSLFLDPCVFIASFDCGGSVVEAELDLPLGS